MTTLHIGAGGAVFTKRRRNNARERLLQLLSDQNWHDHLQLREVAGTRYSARLLELRRLGWSVEDRNLDGSGKAYRLTSLQASRRMKPKRVKLFLSEAQVLELLATEKVSTGVRSELERALESYQLNRDKL